jgi:hypothetical protein
MAKHIPQQAQAKPAPDALDSLVDNRSVVRQLFKAFDQIEGDDDPLRKAELAKAICREIAVKTQNAGDHR